jgi:hypothetical protein
MLVEQAKSKLAHAALKAEKLSKPHNFKNINYNKFFKCAKVANCNTWLF